MNIGIYKNALTAKDTWSIQSLLLSGFNQLVVMWVCCCLLSLMQQRSKAEFAPMR